MFSNATSRGFLIALIAASLFSTKPILIKLAYTHDIIAEHLLLLRLLLAMPIYAVVGVWMWKKHTPALRMRDWFAAAGIGVLGYFVASYLDLKGLELTNAQLERIILYAYPTFVVLLGAWFFNTPIKKHQPPAMLLCYVGIAFLFVQDLSLQGSQVALGALLILLAGLSFALYMLLSKKMIGKMGGLLFTSVAMLAATVASVIMFIVDVLFAQTDSTHSLSYALNFTQHIRLELWGIIVVLTLFATVIPSFMTSIAVKLIGPANSALTGTIGPVVTTLLAVLFLEEAFTWAHAIGMLLVIVGVRLLTQKRKN